MSATLERAKRASTLQVLFRTARLLDAAAVARVRRVHGVPDLRPAHTAVLPHIALEGTRLTTLAARMGVSKQAAGPLVDDLVAQGLLERVPDPSDRRARLIRFVDGGAGLLAGISVLAALEDDLAAHLGQDRWATFREVLLALHDHAASLPGTDGHGPPSTEPPTR